MNAWIGGVSPSAPSCQVAPTAEALASRKLWSRVPVARPSMT